MAQPLFVRPLNDAEKASLAIQARSQNRDESWRAKVILLSAEGRTTAEISKSLGFHQSNVKKWIKKFNSEGPEGLAVRKRGPREGPKPRFTSHQVRRILELSETDPAALGYSFPRWTTQKLASAAVERGIVQRISHVTVRQMLMRNPGSGMSGGSRVEKGPFPTNAVLSQHHSSLALGKEALSRCDFQRAVDCLHDALLEHAISFEDEAMARSLLSRSLEELSRFSEAYEVVRKYEEGAILSSLSGEVRARVKLSLGWANSWLGRYPEAIAHLNDAKKLFHELQDEIGLSEAHFALGRTYGEINEFVIARDHLLAALDSQRKRRDLELLALIHDRLGSTDFYGGSFAGAKQSYLKALELADGVRNPNVLGRILLNLGIVCHIAHLGQREESVEYYRRAIASLEQGGNRALLAHAYNSLADTLSYSGKWDDAIGYLDKSIEVARLLNDARVEATARGTYAEILLARGAYGTAESHLSRVFELIKGGRDRWLEIQGIRILGCVRKAQARVDEALRLLRQSLRLSTSIGDLHGVTLAQVSLAEAHFSLGGLDQAREYLELAKERLKEEESLFLSGLIQRLAGLLETSSGRFAEAKQLIAQSISIFSTTEVPYEMARSQYEMGLLLQKAGEIDPARNHLVRAVETFRRLGAKPAAEMAHTAILGIGDHEHQADPLELRSSALGVRGVGASDLLLMQRLIDASTSRELLLEELGAVLYENFGVEYVVICGASNGHRPELLATWGIDTANAARLFLSIEGNALDAPGEAAGVFVFPLRDDAPARAVLLIRSDHAPDAGRLQPLLKQAELGLEACRLRAATRISSSAKPEHRIRTVIPGFIVANDLMLEVIDKIHKIRTSDVTVLITGESGTGKELVARAIHVESARARAMFIPFNCTATPRELIDSQLFGHRRGAFTGATTNYAGVIRAAEGGTLFLDEIGDLALEIQPKLMRFLQEGEIQTLGEARPVNVDVRVIAATNADLEKAVHEGRFREDLFHRLNIIRIHVPPLRERRDEVPILATNFLEQFCSRSGKRNLAFTKESLEALSAYNWPGNVRQLRNEVERVVAYASEGAQVSVADLSREIFGSKASRLAAGDRDRRVSAVTASSDGRFSALARSSISADGHDAYESGGESRPVKLREAVAELERRLILDALFRNSNNVSRTAIELGLSRRGLRLKLAQLGIDRLNGHPIRKPY